MKRRYFTAAMDEETGDVLMLGEMEAECFVDALFAVRDRVTREHPGRPFRITSVVEQPDVGPVGRALMICRAPMRGVTVPPPPGYNLVTTGTTYADDVCWNKDTRGWEPVDSINEYVSNYIAVARPGSATGQLKREEELKALIKRKRGGPIR